MGDYITLQWGVRVNNVLYSIAVGGGRDGYITVGVIKVFYYITVGVNKVLYYITLGVGDYIITCSDYSGGGQSTILHYSGVATLHYSALYYITLGVGGGVNYLIASSGVTSIARTTRNLLVTNRSMPSIDIDTRAD